MKKTLTLLIVSITCFGFAYLWERKPTTSVCAQNILEVGTSDDYPPYSFNQDGKIVGFDIDLIHEVARRMNKIVHLKNMAFEVLLLELQRGSIHVIASGITPTSDRALKAFLTDPYLQGDPLYAVTLAGAPAITTIAAMKDKTVLVNEGFTADFYISSQKNCIVKRVETVAEAFLALERKKAAVFIIAKSAIAPYFKTRSITDFKIATLEGVTENYAFAVSKQCPELFKTINDTLTTLRDDGTIEHLKRKWNL